MQRRAEDVRDPAPPPRRWGWTWKALPGPAVALAVALAYLALAQFVLVLNDPVNLGAGFWPAAGLSLGALLALPTRRWGWVLAGVGVAELGGDLAQGYALAPTLWWTAGNCIGPLVGAALVRRYGSYRGSLLPVRNLLTFMLLGVVLGPLVGASIGSVGTITGFGTPFWQVWPKYVVGDALGVLVVAPVLLTWREPFDLRRRNGEALLLAATILLVTAAVFRNWSGSWDLTLPYLLVPLLIWAALRHGVRGTARSVFVVTLMANWATATGYGPFAMAGGPEGHAVTLLQMFLVITAASAFILAALASDLSTRDQVEAHLKAQSRRDPLTGLPNRAWLDEHLDAMIDDARQQGRVVAVFVCDLDHFKVVNDSLGHQTGDLLIVEVADRLRRSVRPGDSVARLGGDEFVVVLADASDEVIETLAARIIDSVAAPMQLLRTTQVTPSVSLGVAVSGGAATAGTLLRDADAALYRSKELGRGRTTRFDADLRTFVLDRMMIESDLRPALDAGELSCVFQPEIEVQTGELFGFEALARWLHPVHGLIAPDRFVPVAAATGAINMLFESVLGQVLSSQQRLSRTMGTTVNVAVNLSPGQLRDPSLLETVASSLAAAGTPADALWLEVTEDALAEKADLAALTALRSLGVHVAIDDFGAGWSSMSRLAALPWDLLKIDRSFTAVLGTTLHADHVVEAMIAMAHALGIRTVAEGVETAAQLERLRELGCDIAQGFLISRPLAEDAALGWMLQREAGVGVPGRRTLRRLGTAGGQA